jgi:hypothetical protein
VRHKSCVAAGMAAHEFDDRRDPSVKDRRGSGGLRAVLVDAAKMAGRLAGSAAGAAAGAAAALRNAVPPKVDAGLEEAYWREHYAGEPYYDAMFSFEDYQPAFRTGWEGRAKYAGRSFEDAERELKAEFHWNRGQSRLLWDQARDAVRAAWQRIDRT